MHAEWFIWNDVQAQLPFPCNVSMHYINGNEPGTISLYHPVQDMIYCQSARCPREGFCPSLNVWFERPFACFPFTNPQIRHSEVTIESPQCRAGARGYYCIVLNIKQHLNKCIVAYGCNQIQMCKLELCDPVTSRTCVSACICRSSSTERTGCSHYIS